MARKERTWLCQGCTYAPKAGVVDGMVDCQAAKEVVKAVKHERYRRFESCPYRQKLKPSFLQELARRCRQFSADKGRQPSPEEVARIEHKLKKEMGVKD